MLDQELTTKEKILMLKGRLEVYEWEAENWAAAYPGQSVEFSEIVRVRFEDIKIVKAKIAALEEELKNGS